MNKTRLASFAAYLSGRRICLLKTMIGQNHSQK